MRPDLRKNLVDAGMNIDKALERALHIEAITRIEEDDNQPRISAIQSNESTQLVNSINDLGLTLRTNQSNRQDNQKFSLQRARPKEFLRVSERSSRDGNKPEIEVETIIAITEAALIIDVPIATVERNRQQKEARTEAEIGRTRVVLSIQRQR